ncbi:uncharacterized protein LOC141691245 [Apium graveolens]|uniref:uncharacterized protein LOC141691245 n=1 Tax=Apium graveolens TaxID=4045 RepID=UPI003D7BB460
MDFTFKEADARWVHHPHNDALVISLQIETKNVYRALVDNGSSTNIMYYSSYKKMGLPDRDMSGQDSWVYGFSGEGVRVMGSIRLSYYLKVKEEPSKEGHAIPSHEGIFFSFLFWIGLRGEERILAILSGAFFIFARRFDGGMPGMRYGVDSPLPEGAPLSPKVSEEVDAPVSQGALSVVQNSNEVDAPATQGTPPSRKEVGAPPLEDAPSKQSDEGHNQLDLDPRIPMPTEKMGPTEDMIEIRIDEKDPSKVLLIGSQLVVSGERAVALAEEVDRLLDARLIRKYFYPEWLTNPVLVKKPNGKWGTCVDFTDLNKAYPKDSFPLPRIDQLVDVTAGHALLSFMDAYSGYNQIPIYEPDQEHTSFITDRGLYCYIGMPFGLINVGATYQRLVNKIFKRLIEKTMEVYVDDILVKSKKTENHRADLPEMFHILRKYRMKLNPQKCVFGVESGKFLGCKELFKAIKRKGNDFIWTSDFEEAFQRIKEQLGYPLMLEKPEDGETLILYLAVSEYSISAALVREEEGRQSPVYYVSKWLLDAETRYTSMEKLVYALVLAAQKLRPYFQAHRIEFDLEYCPRTAIKGHALADFILEFDSEEDEKAILLAEPSSQGYDPDKVREEFPHPWWILHVDGALNNKGAGAGIVLITPEGHYLMSTIHFKFYVTNNDAEYEALINGLKIALEVGVMNLIARGDSELVVNQVNGGFQARGP